MTFSADHLEHAWGKPAAGVVHLGDVGAGLRPPMGPRAREHEPRAGGGLGALAEGVRRPFLDVTALRDPALLARQGLFTP
jgi:hypothetical protein